MFKTTHKGNIWIFTKELPLPTDSDKADILDYTSKQFPIMKNDIEKWKRKYLRDGIE